MFFEFDDSFIAAPCDTTNIPKPIPFPDPTTGKFPSSGGKQWDPLDSMTPKQKAALKKSVEKLKKETFK